MTALVYLAAGGVAGTLARAGAGWALTRPGASLPWGTLAANLAGCFLIGLLDARAARGGLTPEARLGLIAGFCGAFTTFSALIWEFDALLRQSPPKALLYLLASALAGWALLRAGAALGAA